LAGFWMEEEIGLNGAMCPDKDLIGRPLRFQRCRTKIVNIAKLLWPHQQKIPPQMKRDQQAAAVLWHDLVREFVFRIKHPSLAANFDSGLLIRQHHLDFLFLFVDPRKSRRLKR